MYSGKIIIKHFTYHIFRIAVDPIFPPPTPWPTSKKFYLPENPLETNKFELIFDERREGHKLKKIFKDSN